MNSLEHAVVSGDHVMVKTLLDDGAEPNILGNNNKPPLYRAVNAGHHAIVEILLACGADPNLDDIKGRTPLHCAAFEGHHAMVEALLARGGDPNMQNIYGSTPLLKATEAGHPAIVKTLLDNGANPNIPGFNKYTPLHRAAADGQHPMVKSLLDKGADADLKNTSGKIPLHLAVTNRHRDVYDILLPKTHQPDWKRLLPRFSQLGWQDQVVEALANGADPNIAFSWYLDTPLHLAAAAGHRDIVEILLVNGADTKLRDWSGKTACQCARAETIKEAIQNFMSVPHSLQFYCRASIRSRLIKCLPDNGLPIKEAAGKLWLTEPMTRYIYRPLSL